MSRKALLLGIADYIDAGLRLPAVKRDLEAMARALQAAGYSQHNIVVKESGAERPLSTPVIEDDVLNFLDEATSDDALLIYFSGHGVELDKRRALVPADFFRRRPLPVTQVVTDDALYAWARGSRAQSVVILIDACREGVELRLAPSGKGAEAENEPAQADIYEDCPTVAIVYSCASGEQSVIERAQEGLSCFTRALTDALTANDELARLDDILFEVSARLDRMPDARGRQHPKLDERRCRGRAGPAETVTIRENLTARLLQRIAESPWRAFFAGSDLFKRAEEGSPLLARQVELIALEAEELSARARREVCAAATGRHYEAWCPRGATERTLSCLELLYHESPDPAAFARPEEAAILLAVPFVYEATLAAAALHLAEAGNPLAPLAPERAGLAEGAATTLAWRAWREYYAAATGWRQRVSLLERRDQSGPANDVTTWRLLTFLHHIGDPWTPYAAGDERRVDCWVHGALAAVFEPFPPAARDRRIRRVLSAERLIRLARLFFCGTDEIMQQAKAGSEQEERLERNDRMGEGPGTWTVDEVKLAHLLAIAGQMALDARRLPVVLAEHLGMDDDLTLDVLQQHLAEAEWRREPNGLSLGVECAHPAIDYALERVLHNLRDHRERLRREEPDISALLPNTFDGEGVRAKRRPGGAPCFERPHIAFQLDQERVRALLMGRQLYGKPELALRELYQNALDACRYRRARETCMLRDRTGDRSAETSYAGRIVLRAGVANGRKYVECEDDGIGMDLRHLRQLFARAGRRFGDSHEFHVEKARWDAAGVPFYPNSRFGIGVFSYFMLADEIEIETRRLNPEGAPGPIAYRVNVVGSGSLFRVRREPAGRATGTRVRLYLNDPDEADLDKLLRGVLEWLWLPQVRTELVLEDRSLTSLEAGQLTPGAEELGGELVIPVPGDSREATAPRLFWVLLPGVLRITSLERDRELYPNTKIILSDGIRTTLPSTQYGSARRSSFQSFPHVLVSLVGPYMPELSIDRKEALAWTVGKAWAEEHLEAHGSRALYGHEGLTFCAVAILSLCYPSTLHRLNEYALQANRPWTLPLTAEQPQVRARADIAGFSVLDPVINLLLTPYEGFGRELHYTSRGIGLSLKDIRLHHQWAILADRLAHLLNAGLPVYREYQDACKFLEAPRARVTGGSTTFLLREVSPWRASSAFSPFEGPFQLVEKVTVQLWHLTSAAHRLRMTLGEAAELAAPLRALGLAVEPPAELPAELRDWRPDQRALRLLSRDLDGVPPFVEQNGMPSFVERVDAAGLVWTAAALGLTLGETAELAAELGAKLRALGLAVEPPAEPPAELRDWRPDGRALRLLSRDFDGADPFLEGPELQGRLHPLALAAAALAMHTTVDAFAPALEALEALGAEVGEAVRFVRWRAERRSSPRAGDGAPKVSAQ